MREKWGTLSVGAHVQLCRGLAPVPAGAATILVAARFAIFQRVVSRFRGDAKLGRATGVRHLGTEVSE